MSSEAFLNLVKDWMNANGWLVERVLSVEAVGSDWEGDTESGFHERFEVDIHYRLFGGRETSDTIGGEYLVSLWKYAVDPDN